MDDLKKALTERILNPEHDEHLGERVEANADRCSGHAEDDAVAPSGPRWLLPFFAFPEDKRRSIYK